MIAGAADALGVDDAAGRRADQPRHRGRHRALHVAGAGARRSARSPHRHLLARPGALRDADRPARLRRALDHRDRRRHPARVAAGARRRRRLERAEGAAPAGRADAARRIATSGRRAPPRSRRGCAPCRAARWPAANTPPPRPSSSIGIGGAAMPARRVFRGAPAYTPRPTVFVRAGRRAGTGQHHATRSRSRPAAVLLAVGGYGAYSWYRGRAAPPAAREPLLLADFANTTGEAVFDGALERRARDSAAAVAVREGAAGVAGPLGAAADGALAERAADRGRGARSVRAARRQGDPARLDRAAQLRLRHHARSAGVPHRRHARARSGAGGVEDRRARHRRRRAARIRERLGESIGSIQKFNVPAPNATTPSLEALKAYSMGIDTRLKTGEVQAIPFFEHALELDPELRAGRGAARRDLHQPARPRAGAELHEARLRAQRLAERARAALHQVALPLHRHRPARRSGGDLPAVDRDLSRTTGCRTTICRRPTRGWIRTTTRSRRRGPRCGSAPNSVVAYQQLTRALLALDRLSEAQEVDARGAVEGARLVGRCTQLAFDLAFIDQRRRRHAGAPARGVRASRRLSRGDRGGARGVRHRRHRRRAARCTRRR